MPITGLRFAGASTRWLAIVGAILMCPAAARGAEDTPYAALARLASALGAGDAVAAAGVFDTSMENHATIGSALEALTAQSDILCATDVVAEKEDGDTASLDVDWYMDLKPRTPSGPGERRRERVALRMKKIRGNWQIISFSPLRMLAPVTIR